MKKYEARVLIDSEVETGKAWLAMFVQNAVEKSIDSMPSLKLAIETVEVEDWNPPSDICCEKSAPPHWLVLTKRRPFGRSSLGQRWPEHP